MTKTFIYGSCVSRDTFEILPRAEFELVEYVARQSLISAVADPNAEALPPLDVRSPFQRRMLVGDWESSLLGRLRRQRHTTDLLLWDLCDERLGVRRAPHGVTTRSVDSIAAGLDDLLEDRTELLPFGTEEHLAAFTEALTLFRDALDDLAMLDRTVLLAPPWATAQDDGSPSPAPFGLTPDDANPVFARYHDAVLAVMKIPLITLPADRSIRASRHRWGPAPFHYTDEVYRHLAAQIDAHRPPPPAPPAPSRPRVFHHGPRRRSAIAKVDADLRLTGNVRQQSLISAANPPSALFPEASALTGSARVVEADLRSTLFDAIRSAADRTDLFVFDLSVELLGVHKLPDGTFVTASPELRRVDLLTSLDTSPGLILPGTERHARLWTRSAGRLVKLLNELKARERTLVVLGEHGSADPALVQLAQVMRDLEVRVADDSGPAAISRAVQTVTAPAPGRSR